MTRQSLVREPIAIDDRIGGMALMELIAALKGQQGRASALLDRIDPAVSDELRAYAVHRHLDLMTLAADALEQLAADAADRLWQLGITRNSRADQDAEAVLLGAVLRMAFRSRLRSDPALATQRPSPMRPMGFVRVGQPYRAI